MGRYGDLNYARLTKTGFALGVGLFALGVAGSAIGPAIAGPLPGWERTLLVEGEVAGILVAFVSVFGFGIVLPLTE
ncbi:DUF7860 family protein [Halococcus agarilyticus]|uniref:DUF7860 family protein n=1 Tax=Halococcus agarilyticus TaxID=1232219 RepID=UPI000677EE04|nr:hypothetical protein [Halococcus agarilyticus]